jgi:hypothetical protein
VEEWRELTKELKVQKGVGGAGKVEPKVCEMVVSWWEWWLVEMDEMAR